MRGTLAIAWREIVERRFVLAAAAIASLVPVALPLVRGLGGTDAAQARAGAALILSTAFALGLMIGLGVSMIAPSIASRRIGFDFSRPVSSGAIWAGRLGGSLFLAISAAILVWFPARLLGTEMPWRDLLVDAEIPRVGPLVLLAGLLAAFCFAHAASVMTRSRSALLALDAALAIAAGFAFSAILARLPSFLAMEPRIRAAWGFAIVVGAGLAAAGLASVSRGRTDIRAAHRVLSRVLWAFVAAGLAGALAYASWVMAARPRDIGKGFWVVPAASGRWVKVDGEARGAQARFLFDTETGRHVRAATVDWSGGPVMSRDGTRAAWIEGRSQGGPLEAIAMTLDGTGARPTRTRLFFPGYPSLFVLSPDGFRLATVEDGVLSIHDLAGARTLVSGRLRKGSNVRGFFVDDGRFRAYVQPDVASETARVEIFELEVESKSLRKTGEIGVSAGSLFLAANRSGDRVVAVAYRDKAAWLCDGTTGTVLAPLADGVGETSRWPGFLADGRIVLSESSPRAARLLVFRTDGTREGLIPLPASRFVALGGEVEPARVVVALGEGSRIATHLVDLDSGTVRKIAEDLYPAARLSGVAWELGATPEVGSEATRLFTRGGSELVRFDPVTGRRTTLLATPSRWREQ